MKLTILFTFLTTALFSQIKPDQTLKLGTTGTLSANFVDLQTFSATRDTLTARLASLYYSVKSYGAVGDNVTNNTTAIQAAVNACHAAGGGIVYFPAGTYKTNKIETYTNVTIKGDGYISTFIKSISADTMFAIHNLAPALAGVQYNDLSNNLIEDVSLDGNSVGTIGFYANRAANFRIYRVFFTKFTGKGLILHNSLIGNVENCYFINNPRGIFGFADGTNNTATTHVSVSNCVVNAASKWAIDWSGGGMLHIQNGDFEGNGSVNDTTTGSIYYHNNTWPGGLSLYGCWFEENMGTNINISANVNGGNFNNNTIHSIIGCQDLGQFYSFQTRNIYLQGNNQKLSVVGSTFSKAATSIVADGTNTSINLMGSYYTNSALRSGATITTVGN